MVLVFWKKEETWSSAEKEAEDYPGSFNEVRKVWNSY